MVLEKAYAKLNGSFDDIVAGKVQFALADLTGGFPEMIDLGRDVKNVDTFWEKVLGMQKHGALMGGGTPPHAQGDSAINESNIVFGHAYAVMQAVDVDGIRLL